MDHRHTALMLVVVFVATFMDGLDGSIVSVALPEIGEDLGVDTATSSWVTIIYMMILKLCSDMLFLKIVKKEYMRTDISMTLNQAATVMNLFITVTLARYRYGLMV